MFASQQPKPDEAAKGSPSTEPDRAPHSENVDAGTERLAARSWMELMRLPMPAEQQRLELEAYARSLLGNETAVSMAFHRESHSEKQFHDGLSIEMFREQAITTLTIHERSGKDLLVFKVRSPTVDISQRSKGEEFSKVEVARYPKDNYSIAPQGHLFFQTEQPFGEIVPALKRMILGAALASDFRSAAVENYPEFKSLMPLATVLANRAAPIEAGEQHDLWLRLRSLYDPCVAFDGKTLFRVGQDLFFTEVQGEIGEPGSGVDVHYAIGCAKRIGEHGSQTAKIFMLPLVLHVPLDTIGHFSITIGDADGPTGMKLHDLSEQQAQSHIREIIHGILARVETPRPSIRERIKEALRRFAGLD